MRALRSTFACATVVALACQATAFGAVMAADVHTRTNHALDAADECPMPAHDGNACPMHQAPPAGDADPSASVLHLSCGCGALTAAQFFGAIGVVPDPPQRVGIPLGSGRLPRSGASRTELPTFALDPPPPRS